MKVKDQYIKILKNILTYNKNFSYDGSRCLRYYDNTVLIEAEVPDFLDLPIYTNNLEEILKFWTPETDIYEEAEGNINYLVLVNDKGKIKYRLSKSQLLAPEKPMPPIINLKIAETYFKFNLDYNKFSNLIKISNMLECDTVEVYSIDERKIGLKSFQINDKRNKSYIIEIECDHEHTDKKCRFSLNRFNIIMASDYNFELGRFDNKKQNEFIKVKAFNGNVEMTYVFPNNI